MQTLAKNKVLLFIIGFLLLANVGILLSFSWKRELPKKEARPERPDLSISHFLEKEVGFSSEQLKEFEQLKQAYRAARKPLFEELGTAKENFFKLLQDSTVTDSTLNAAANLIGERQIQVDLQAFRHFKAMRNMCTPEQLPKYDAKIQDRIRMMISPFHKGNWHKQDSLKIKK